MREARSFEVLGIAEQIKPLLAGRDPEIIGAVLCELLSLWLAGHQPEARDELLRMHVAMVKLMVPVNAALIRGEPMP